jgi:hypothetical protein
MVVFTIGGESAADMQNHAENATIVQFCETEHGQVYIAFEVLGEEKLQDASVPLIVFTPGGQVS